jgi:hypothetical protein
MLMPCLSVALWKKERIMDAALNQIIKTISLSILFSLLLGIENIESHANDTDITQATFYVY